jgi:hypothetical protein
MQKKQIWKVEKFEKGDKKKRPADFFQRLFTWGKEPQSFTNIGS